MRRLIVSLRRLTASCKHSAGRKKNRLAVYLGGWMFGYGDESMDISASGFDGKDRELGA
jgi:hypothetical protein